MRTILSIEDDVAAVLERMRKARDISLKDLVNEALRRGLQDMSKRSPPRQPFRTRSVDSGRLPIGSIDDIGEVLAIAEGDDYK